MKEKVKEQVQEPEKKKFSIRPLHLWVLIRKVERQEVVKDGVIQVAGGRSSRGIVVAAAKEVPLNAGDYVIFTNFPIELEDLEEVTGDRSLKLVRYEEVYGVIEEEIAPSLIAPCI